MDMPAPPPADEGNTANTPIIEELDDAFLGLNHQDAQDMDGVDIALPESSKRPRQPLEQAATSQVPNFDNALLALQNFDVRQIQQVMQVAQMQLDTKDCTTWTLVRHNKKKEEQKFFQATNPKENAFVGDERQRPPSNVSFSQSLLALLFSSLLLEACSDTPDSGISRSYPEALAADDPGLWRAPSAAVDAENVSKGELVRVIWLARRRPLHGGRRCLLRTFSMRTWSLCWATREACGGRPVCTDPSSLAMVPASLTQLIALLLAELVKASVGALFVLERPGVVF